MFVDTNVFIYANFDTSEKGEAAKRILERIENGTKATTSALVIDEVMWVVRKYRREELQAVVNDIYSLANLTVLSISSAAPLRAVELMQKHNLKPHDAIHLATMEEAKTNTIVSDDPDFDRVSGIKRIAIN